MTGISIFTDVLVHIRSICNYIIDLSSFNHRLYGQLASLKAVFFTVQVYAELIP